MLQRQEKSFYTEFCHSATNAHQRADYQRYHAVADTDKSATHLPRLIASVVVDVADVADLWQIISHLPQMQGSINQQVTTRCGRMADFFNKKNYFPIAYHQSHGCQVTRQHNMKSPRKVYLSEQMAIERSIYDVFYGKKCDLFWFSNTKNIPLQRKVAPKSVKLSDLITP